MNPATGIAFDSYPMDTQISVGEKFRKCQHEQHEWKKSSYATRKSIIEVHSTYKLYINYNGH